MKILNLFKKHIQLSRNQQQKNYSETINSFSNLSLKDILMLSGKNKNIPDKIMEPQTIAKYRLENGALDYGAREAKNSYDGHRVKLNNQWVNALTSLNSGYANQQYSFYNYQVVNYWEAMTLEQDPLMNKILNILSTAPFSKGGEIVDNNLSAEEINTIERFYSKLNINNLFIEIVKKNFGQGGCLLYLDFGNDINLTQPLALNNINIKKDFRGFKIIEPINIAPLAVNTAEPAKQNYMEPEQYYVVGLGTVHKSHFLKFTQNEPPFILKPLCLYFGFPLTTLIKQDIANTNMVSQSIAELIGRFRYVFLKTPRENFTGSQVEQFRDRLEALALLKDNYQIDAISTEEEIIQINTQLTGLKENEEFFYQIIAAKTGIPLTELLGTSASGMKATGEGDRKSWYDKVISIQQSIKTQLLTVLGILGGLEDGIFKEINDYMFTSLETLDQKEQTELAKIKLEMGKTLIELGYDPENVSKWLQEYKYLNLGVML